MIAFRAARAHGARDRHDEQAAELRRHGYSDRDIADIVGLAALSVLAGAFNLVAGLQPEQDVSGSATRRDGVDQQVWDGLRPAGACRADPAAYP